MRSKRSVRLEAKWREIVAVHPGSGQTIRAYCKGRHVTEASFFFWRRELERRAQPLAASPRLIPVRVLPDPSLRLQVRAPRVMWFDCPVATVRSFPTCFAP